MFVPVIGLVGGVGSGKSALAGEFAERRNFVVIDGDETGHRVLEDQTVEEQIRSHFGDLIFNREGKTDRAALGRKVFGATSEHRRALADLERIVHPRIREVFVGRIAEARASKTTEAVLLDAAVLFEAGWDDLCDAVVFVHTPEPTRTERIEQSRGWDRRRLKIRETSQFPLESKRNRADYIVDNSNTLAETEAQLEQILRQIIQQHG